MYWQKKLARANVDYAAYAKALATELWALVCVEDVNAVYILRGMIQSKLLRVTCPKDLEIVNFITSKHCPVSAWLTDDDKAKLLAIKQDLEAAKQEQ